MKFAILFFVNILIFFLLYMLFITIDNIFKFKITKSIRDWADKEVQHIYDTTNYVFDLVLFKILTTRIFIWLEPIFSALQTKTKKISNFSLEKFKKNKEEDLKKYNKISSHLKNYITKK